MSHFVIHAFKNRFIVSIKQGSSTRVEGYRAKEGGWFTHNNRLARQLTDDLDFPLLVHAKLTESVALSTGTSTRISGSYRK
jgi:hypothetical protein